MIKTFKDFFYFIINPSLQNIQIKASWGALFKKLSYLLILTIVFNGLIIVMRAVLINKGVIPPLFFKNKGYSADFWIFPLTVLFISPVIEELGFRLFFIPKRINIAVSLSLLLYFLAYLVLSFKLFGLNIYLIIPLTSFIILVLVTSKISVLKSINKFIIKYLKPIFYISTVFYVYVHIDNFLLENKHIVWLPFIFLPYLMLGLELGYIRISCGIKYSILFHIVYNIFPFLLSLAFLR